MSRYNEVGSHKTAVYQNDNGMTAVRYHATEVVQFDADKIILKSGGWETVTTKLRMNQASHQFGLGYGVYQRNFSWFVDYNNETLPFEDGMVLERRI